MKCQDYDYPFCVILGLVPGIQSEILTSEANAVWIAGINPAMTQLKY